MKQKNYKIIVSGGGTGGHVYPAIAIANELHKYPVEILFVGAKHKLEMKVVPQAGYKIIGLPIQGFQRRLTYKNILFIINLIRSIYLSKKIIKKFTPDLAIGVGGYASAPIIYLSSKRNIPTTIQEQNSYPGLANKFLAKRVNKIFVAYKNMERFFPKDKIVYTGNPVRKDLLNIQGKKMEAFKYFGLQENKKTLLVLGGSLGARTINESLMYKLLDFQQKDIQVLWQTGKFYYKEVSRLVKQSKLPNVVTKAFIDRMDYAYFIADLIVSRAGAITISEICIVQKPSILVPSPNVAEDHQTKNAMALVEKNAAIMVKDNDAIDNLLPMAFNIITNKKKLTELAHNIKPLARKMLQKILPKKFLNYWKNEL